VHIEDIVNRPSPQLLILEDTYNTELEARKEIEEMLRTSVHFSQWNETQSAHKKVQIGLNSIVFFLAERFASEATELKSTVHMRKEHFSNALYDIRNLLAHGSIEVLALVEEWERVAEKFLSSQLALTSMREAIFRTCEQFRIDLIDFSTVFPKLPVPEVKGP
jgi:hypothetical protein